MKKKEKLVILVLLIITIALVVVGIVTKSNSNNETKISDGENSHVNDENEPQNEKELKDKYVVYLDDGTRVNSSDKVKKARTINGIELSNFQITEKDNMTKLFVNLKNTTNETKTTVVYNIALLDDKGNEMQVLSIYIPEIGAGETRKGATSVSGDYANAYDLKIEG